MSTILASILAVTLAQAAPAPAPETWHAAPPMLHARAAHAVVATADAVYALGGTGSDDPAATEVAPVLEVERFDGRAWSVETKLPCAGLNAPAAAVIGRRIYLIGGFDTLSNVPTAKVRVYDLETRAWSEAKELPAPRGGHAAAVLDGRIHVLGGGNSVSTIADHSEYDPALDAWTARAPLPRAKGSPAAVVFEGRIWAIGGRSGPGDFGEVDLYDARADAWTSGPPIAPRGTAGAVVHAGAIDVFGGESQASGRVLDEVLRLDPSKGKWESISPLPTARNYARAVEFAGSVLVIGGSGAAGASHASLGSTTVERFGAPPR
jgi:N-acetylneuraminic acid mutarotase